MGLHLCDASEEPSQGCCGSSFVFMTLSVGLLTRVEVGEVDLWCMRLMARVRNGLCSPHDRGHDLQPHRRYLFLSGARLCECVGVHHCAERLESLLSPRDDLCLVGRNVLHRFVL